MEYQYIVYSLVCPIDGLVKYVGVTSCGLENRLNGHCTEKKNLPKNKWIAELKAKGLKPLILKLQGCNDNHLTVEQKWIRKHKATLLNIQQHEPSAIYTIRYDKEKLQDLRSRHGRKLHDYLKSLMTKIDIAGRISDTDQD